MKFTKDDLIKPKTLSQRREEFQLDHPCQISKSHLLHMPTLFSDYCQLEDAKKWNKKPSQGAFPKEFDPKKLRATNGILEVGAINISEFPHRDMKKILEICDEYWKKYGLYCAPNTINVGNDGHAIRHLVSFPYTLSQNATGEWVAEKKEKATAQFFGMAVALGLVTEDALFKSDVMLGKEAYETLAVIKQLKDEGVISSFATPLHSGKESNGIGIS